MRLKDWFKSGLQNAAIIMGASVLYGVLMEQKNVSQMLNIAAMYMLLFGAVINILFNISLYKVTLPLSLGFGSTRKEAFVGMQCYRLVYAVLLLAGASVLYLLAGEAGEAELMQLIPIGVGLLPSMTALGAVIGMVGERFGKGTIAVLTTIGAVLGACIVIASVILIAIFVETDGNGILWLVPVVGFVIYALVSIVEHKTVKKYSVKL